MGEVKENISTVGEIKLTTGASADESALSDSDGDISLDKIGTNNLSDGSITQVKLAALNYQLSSSCGTFSATNQADMDITNLSVSITTTGRPILIGLMSDGSSDGSHDYSCQRSMSGYHSKIAFKRGSTVIAPYGIEHYGAVASSQFYMIDAPAAGSYTYKAVAMCPEGTIILEYAKLYVLEL
jgi:hypothetical protein